MAFQLIDEQQEFNAAGGYLAQVFPGDKLAQVGRKYKIISVFGSQSSGKSTLLNKLFNTEFSVMEDSRRQQTTKGIWFSFCADINCSARARELPGSNSLFIMDVEGSDGRERGEDQDFERKAALFALATSQIFMINIWEHQIGLYQGANLGLLKTVFEVYLLLFKDRQKKHKVLLLFVIRDFVGSTPLENLKATLTTDLLKIWNDLTAHSTDLQFADYFDLSFQTTSHKFLQHEQFEQDIVKIGDYFSDLARGEESHENMPIDGWDLFAENCWKQIKDNKKLDLPTQHILVSRFRCDEILKGCLVNFDQSFKNHDNATFSFDKTHSLYTEALDTFHAQAANYDKSVFELKKQDLVNELNLKMLNLFNDYYKYLAELKLGEFKHKLGSKQDEDAEADADADHASEESENLALLKEYQTAFQTLIAPFAEFEIGLDKPTKEFNDKSSEILAEFNKAKTIASVSEIINNDLFEIISAEPVSEAGDDDGDSQTDVPVDTAGAVDTGEKIWGLVGSKLIEKNITDSDLIKEIFLLKLNREKILDMLVENFNNKFNFEEQNLMIPKIWLNEEEIKKNYVNLTNLSFRILKKLSATKFSATTKLKNFKLVKNDEDLNKIKKLFLSKVEVSFRNANSNLILLNRNRNLNGNGGNGNRIPSYIYILLIILGWNEFVLILKNPLLLVLIVLLISTYFVINSLNLWNPLVMSSNLMFTHLKNDFIKNYLNLDNLNGNGNPNTANTNANSGYNEKRKEF